MKNNISDINLDAVPIYDLSKIIPSIIIEINPEYLLKDATKILSNKLLDYGIYMELIPIKEDIDLFLSEFNNEISFNIIILNIFCVLSIIVISTIINYTIQKIEYNIGILYSIGATINDIVKILIKKLILSHIISLVLGNVLYLFIKKSVYLFFVSEIQGKYIIYTIIIYFIIITISFIAPIRKITKYTPIDLLREGRE